MKTAQVTLSGAAPLGIARRASIAALLGAALAAACACAAEQLPVQRLGAAPLCEASAALVIDCPGGGGRCLLVGDNEVSRSLFLFRLHGQGIDVASQRAPALDDRAELADIEALTRLPNGNVAVFSSHGRSSDCERQPERNRFGVVDRLTDKSARVRVVQSGPIGCATLFGDTPLAQPLLRAACEAIDAAEARASDIDQRRRDGRIGNKQAKKECNKSNAYNAEGVVNVSGEATPEVWVGLRAPLLPRHPQDATKRNLAMLLHLRSLDRYAFDRVVALDLGGRGVRDLTYDNGSVWLIAGPAEDEPDDQESPFQLMRFGAELLRGGAVIVPERVGSGLPSRSEGIAVFGDKLLVVIDGDQPRKAKQPECGKNKPGLVVVPVQR